MRKIETKPELGVAGSATSETGRFVEMGGRIARLRHQKGWNQALLARRLRVSRERVSKWERGENAPPLEILVALRRVLGVSLDELVTGKASLAAELCGEERERVTECLSEVRQFLVELASLAGGGAQGAEA